MKGVLSCFHRVQHVADRGPIVGRGYQKRIVADDRGRMAAESSAQAREAEISLQFFAYYIEGPKEPHDAI